MHIFLIYYSIKQPAEQFITANKHRFNSHKKFLNSFKHPPILISSYQHYNILIIYNSRSP